jgi:uncharacterized protein YjbI with pentapeptide repeats
MPDHMSIFNSLEFEGQTFRKQSLNKVIFTSRIFLECEFEHCDINETDFSNSRFSECKFLQSRISMASLKSCKMQDVSFSESKIVGVDFSECDPLLLSMAFDRCSIQSANFSQMNLRGIGFLKSIVKECRFIETELTAASFKGCDLSGTIFHNTILTEADLTDACNYRIDPMTNKLRKARFSLPEAVTLLEMLQIEIE